MNLFLSSFAVAFAVSVSVSAFQAPLTYAQEMTELSRPRTEFGQQFWSEVRQLIEKCAIQTVAIDEHGRKIQGPLRSSCAEVQVSGNGVAFELQGERFFAFLEESKNSDGGDLNNVIVQNARAEVVAYRSDVVAFGDVLLGLAGNLEGVREVMDQSILD